MRLRIFGPHARGARKRALRAFAGGLSAALLAAAAGCSSIEEPAEIFTAEGALQPADGVVDPITGTVAMVIQARNTQIGIGLRAGQEGEEFGWSVRNGSCNGTGERIGPASAFPPIVIDEDGEGQAETVIVRRIDVDERYAAEVFDQPDGTGPVQACADLVPGT